MTPRPTEVLYLQVRSVFSNRSTMARKKPAAGAVLSTYATRFHALALVCSQSEKLPLFFCCPFFTGVPAFRHLAKDAPSRMDRSHSLLACGASRSVISRVHERPRLLPQRPPTRVREIQGPIVRLNRVIEELGSGIVIYCLQQMERDINGLLCRHQIHF